MRNIPLDNDPKYVVIHTAAAANEDNVPVYQPASVIRDYHRSKGWLDIGYHYYIEKDGRIVPGRAELARGAHCVDLGMNRKSIGICCAGHGDFADFLPAQYASLYDLIVSICQRFSVTVCDVVGHRETGAPKTCPGNRVDMQKIREEVARRMKDA